MKSALEILKECREQLVPKPFAINPDLEKLKSIIEEDINSSLIQQIQLHPSLNTWLIRIPVKNSYLTTLRDINHIKILLHFIREIVEKPFGFKLHGTITYLDVFNEIGLQLAEEVVK